MVKRDKQWLEIVGLYDALMMFRQQLDSLGPASALSPNRVKYAGELREAVENAYTGLFGSRIQDLAAAENVTRHVSE